MKTIALSLAVASLLSSATAASFTRAYVKTYDGPAQGSDTGTGIGINAIGEVYVTGQSASTAGSPYLEDFVTLKFSNAGVCLWTNRYHGPGTNSDIAHALVLDSAGNVIVTGESSGVGTREDYATLKYSPQGVPLWTNRYHVPADDAKALAIAADTNDNIYVTGYSYYSGLATIKYSPSGIALWTNIFLDSVKWFAYPTAIAVDGKGKVIVSGFLGANGSTDDALVVAYSTAGVPLWTNRYDGPDGGDDVANNMALDSNGNVFIAGGTAAAGQTEFLVIKYSNNGVSVWTNRYRGGGSTYGGASAIGVDQAGNVFVAGANNGSGTYGDFLTLKYSNNGVPLWTNRYSSVYDDAAIAVVLDRNGNVFVSGYFTDAYSLRFDAAVVVYSNSGVLLWSDTYAGQANNDASASRLAADRSGNVFATGYSRNAAGYGDVILMKYSTTLVNPPLEVQPSQRPMVLSWANTLFSLQSATSISGTFTNVPGATSPWTNSLSGTTRFFRLKGN